MTKRRANHEGTVYQRSDGRWEGKATLPNGRRRSVYGHTQQQVIRELAMVRRSVEDGLPPAPRRKSVTQLIHEWLDSKHGNIRPSTQSNCC